MGIFNALFGGSDKSEDEERQEMMERINADAERRLNNKDKGREAANTYQEWAQSSEKVEYELDLKNKKVAAKLGWEKPKKEDSKAEPPKARKLIDTDTGLGDDGYMYYYYTYDNGDVEHKRM
jgi:hypothetical protein